jgi:hypothetical protein
MEYTQKYIFAVEAADDRGWMIVPHGTFIGEKEAEDEAAGLMKQWIDAGWSKDKIRLTKSPFQRKTNINA